MNGSGMEKEESFKEKMSPEGAHHHRRPWIRAWRKKEINEGRGRGTKISTLSISFNIVAVVYGINLKILMSHNNSFQNCPMYGVAC